MGDPCGSVGCLFVLMNHFLMGPGESSLVLMDPLGTDEFFGVLAIEVSLLVLRDPSYF